MEGLTILIRYNLNLKLKLQNDDFGRIKLRTFFFQLKKFAKQKCSGNRKDNIAKDFKMKLSHKIVLSTH